MAKDLLLLLFCWLFAAATAFPQSGAASASSDVRLKVLDEALYRGEKKALRDLVSLIEKPGLRTPVLAILKKHTLFTDTELAFSNSISRQDLFDFYYENESKILFSRLLNAFYISPVNVRKAAYKIKPADGSGDQDPTLLLREYTQQFDQSMSRLKRGKSSGKAEVLGHIRQIGQLQSEEGARFLLDVLQKKQISQRKHPEIITQLLQSLADRPRQESVSETLRLLREGSITSQTANPLLAQFTNVAPESSKAKVVLDFYQTLFDSLGNLEAVRQHGYRQVFRFQESFFEHPVDYYGRILSKADDYFWIQRNALWDVQQSAHPRVLFYLASQMVKFRFSPDRALPLDDYRKIIERLTGLQVGIVGKDGKIQFRPDWENDPTALVNYLIYWARHYEDYEWDEDRQVFANMREVDLLSEDFERLFRLLNSRNDSVSISAYQKLTLGDPAVIIPLAEKYRDLFSSTNPSIPSLKKRFLENLVLLTDFCRKNKFPILAAPALSKKLRTLEGAITEATRYQLEMEIIENLAFEDITAIEYWGLMRGNRLEVAFSAGHILDQAYSRYWPMLAENDDWLRLYLKKAHLFSHIGSIGACNNYLKKFDQLESKLRDRLAAIQLIETDSDILFQISKLSGHIGNVQLSLNWFLENPGQFSRHEVLQLPAPDSTTIEQVVLSIRKFNPGPGTDKLIQYFDMHESKNLTASLMLLLQLDIKPNRVLPILRKIFHYQFSSKRDEDKAQWLSLWQSDKRNMDEWEERFFKKNLNNLLVTEELDIQSINRVAASSYFSTETRRICLESLSKLKSMRSIRRLRIEPKITDAEALFYIEKLPLDYKILDDVPKLLAMEDPSIILGFLEKKADEFELEEQGFFFNKLFRQDWFSKLLISGKARRSQVLRIKTALQSYLNDSESISLFEEESALIHLFFLENLGKDLNEKLAASTQLDIDPAGLGRVQAFTIASIPYAEIPLVLDQLDKLSFGKKAGGSHFIHNDFGIPFFNLGDAQEVHSLSDRLQNSEPAEVYDFYLSRMDLDFKTKRGQLDFEKIFDLLEFGITLPFAGSGGSQRDYFTYGLVKRLEFHFGTTLGFHEKLNENQTFYVHTCARRAAAWQDFLIQEKMVKRKENRVRSFATVPGQT